MCLGESAKIVNFRRVESVKENSIDIVPCFECSAVDYTTNVSVIILSYNRTRVVCLKELLVTKNPE